VYIGSFNSDAPINTSKNPHCVELFKAEQDQLLSDLYEIPSRSCDRKVGVLRLARTSVAVGWLWRCTRYPHAAATGRWVLAVVFSSILLRHALQSAAWTAGSSVT
jgi:hypothetical protein